MFSFVEPLKDSFLSSFLAAMENILGFYVPYNEDYPVISFDERLCFLIGDKVERFGLKFDQVRKKTL